MQTLLVCFIGESTVFASNLALAATKHSFLLQRGKKPQRKWKHASLNIVNNHFDSSFTVITKSRKTLICSTPPFSLSLPSHSLIGWLRDGHVLVISDSPLFIIPTTPPAHQIKHTSVSVSKSIYIGLLGSDARRLISFVVVVSAREPEGGRKKKEVKLHEDSRVWAGRRFLIHSDYLQLNDRADTGLLECQCCACLLLVTI